MRRPPSIVLSCLLAGSAVLAVALAGTLGAEEAREGAALAGPEIQAYEEDGDPFVQERGRETFWMGKADVEMLIIINTSNWFFPGIQIPDLSLHPCRSDVPVGLIP